jgi:hypothetical protein
MFIWTLFGTHDIPMQLWVSRDLDKQGNTQVSIVEWIGIGDSTTRFISCMVRHYEMGKMAYEEEK